MLTYIHMRTLTIKAVSERTGLSPHVIRVWEQRYNAVVPARTESNRRIYTDAEVDRLRLLNRATQAGHSIGLIAGLTTSELQDIVTQDFQPTNDRASPPPESEQTTIDSIMKAIALLDSSTVSSELANAARTLGPIAFLNDIVDPLMQRIGDDWHDGNLRVAQEHLATAAVTSFLNGLRDSQRTTEAAPRIVIATPARQFHEVGALLTATTAAIEGWHVIYLGSDLPADEIAYAATTQNARAVALSIVFPPDDPHLGHELIALRRGIGDRLPLFVGGNSARSYESEISLQKGQIIDSLQSLSTALSEMRTKTRL